MQHFRIHVFLNCHDVLCKKVHWQSWHDLISSTARIQKNTQLFLALGMRVGSKDFEQVQLQDQNLARVRFVVQEYTDMCHNAGL
jgi:hypothetical protein